MSKTHPVAAGQRFRDVERNIFGGPGSVWIVEHLQTGIDGLAYAQVVSAADPSVRKTLSIAILTDRRRFVPQGDR